jgi:SH3-like domain-containing protein
MFGQAFSLSPLLHHLRAGVLALLAGLAAVPAVPVAAAEGPTTGLPLPRFASTRSQPINVRVGPGTKYDVAWVYVKAGTPVEIVQEFDTWRKIRDVDGSEGWIHQNLLSGKRAGVIALKSGETQAVLHSARAEDSGVQAYLGPGYRVDISECDGKWCEVSATYTPEPGHNAHVSGFLPQSELWGVYPDEEVD